LLENILWSADPAIKLEISAEIDSTRSAQAISQNGARGCVDGVATSAELRTRVSAGEIQIFDDLIYIFCNFYKF
jgi:hypothetical protein